MKGSTSERSRTTGSSYRPIDWELRPGGMLVQKREVGEDHSPAFGPMIKVKVSHGSHHYDISIPAQSTFGDLKKLLTQETGLQPKEQRLLFTGKEKEDGEFLHIVGVKDMSKIILLEDPASKEKKLEEMKRNLHMMKAYEEVAKVRVEVDQLSEKVVALERTISHGAKVADREFGVLIELLMAQLLKLDSIEADGEAKAQRRTEVRRVQSLLDALDQMKARNSNPFINVAGNATSVNTKWEMFGSGVGSLVAPIPTRSATQITQDWEMFD